MPHPMSAGRLIFSDAGLSPVSTLVTPIPLYALLDLILILVWVITFSHPAAPPTPSLACRRLSCL